MFFLQEEEKLKNCVTSGLWDGFRPGKIRRSVPGCLTGIVGVHAAGRCFATAGWKRGGAKAPLDWPQRLVCH